MKIGDFAKACSTKISVLRHYDKQGLLKPLYIDRFTEYRYYDRSQIAVFERIAELKAVGFSLAEIRRMLYSNDHTEAMFADKKAELEQQLRDLAELKDRLSGGIITGDEKHTWTRGYWLRKWNNNACAYEIKEFGGREYLIIEWKSGDYRYGGRESSYYVMTRE